ncbi:TniQ family protein [Rhizobium sp. LjRoot98]|uniref:TniQ family protein n=1 Tax=Rhizobium sp. LjRoot98 TaxID=3342345 RepID=UPI003ED167D8
MTEFTLIPDYRTHEAPESFVSRLAAYNCALSIDELFTQLGSKLDTYRVMKQDRFDRVLAMAEVPREVYEPFSFRREAKQGFAFVNGEKVFTDELCRRRPRYCPCCVSADLDANIGTLEARTHQRFFWFLKPIELCPEHGCALITSDYSEQRRDAADFAPYVRENAQAIRKEALAATREEARPFEIYVLDRVLGNAREPSFLDHISLHVVIDFCLSVGRLVTGAKIRENVVDSGALRRAGFAILAAGESGFLDYLADRASQIPDDRRSQGSKQYKYAHIYGKLSQHLDDPEWRPLIEMITEDALRTIPLAAGEEFLGRIVDQRRFHSLHSASQHSGVHPKTLARLLLENGAIDKNIGRTRYASLLFSTESVDTVLTQITNSVTSGTVRRSLRLTTPMLGVFSAAGIVRGAEFNSDSSKRYPRYRRDDLQQALSKIEAAPKVSSPDENFRPLMASRIWAGVPPTDVFKRLGDPNLRCQRVEGQQGLRSLYVHEDDVIVEKPDSGLIAVSDAAREIGTGMRAIQNLVKYGFLDSDQRHDAFTPNKKVLVNRQELMLFAGRHVSLQAISTQTGIIGMNLVKAMAAENIHPIYPVETKKDVRLYERAKVDAFLERTDLVLLMGLRKRNSVLRARAA